MHDEKYLYQYIGFSQVLLIRLSRVGYAQHKEIKIIVIDLGLQSYKNGLCHSR